MRRSINDQLPPVPQSVRRAATGGLGMATPMGRSWGGTSGDSGGGFGEGQSFSFQLPARQRKGGKGGEGGVSGISRAPTPASPPLPSFFARCAKVDAPELATRTLIFPS